MEPGNGSLSRMRAIKFDKRVTLGPIGVWISWKHNPLDVTYAPKSVLEKVLDRLDVGRRRKISHINGPILDRFSSGRRNLMNAGDNARSWICHYLETGDCIVGNFAGPRDLRCLTIRANFG